MTDVYTAKATLCITISVNYILQFLASGQGLLSTGQGYICTLSAACLDVQKQHAVVIVKHLPDTSQLAHLNVPAHRNALCSDDVEPLSVGADLAGIQRLAH